MELILYAGSNILQYELQVVDNDPGHLGRLLQLILGVAINCDTKTDHIQALLTMEQDVQRVVMMAIQELTGEGGEPSPSLPTIEDDAALAQLMKVTTMSFYHLTVCSVLPCNVLIIIFISFKTLPQDMESTKCEKERLAQKCHDLEMQLNLMKEEKSNLSGAVLGSVF